MPYKAGGSSKYLLPAWVVMPLPLILKLFLRRNSDDVKKTAI